MDVRPLRELSIGYRDRKMAEDSGKLTSYICVCETGERQPFWLVCSYVVGRVPSSRARIGALRSHCTACCRYKIRPRVTINVAPTHHAHFSSVLSGFGDRIQSLRYCRTNYRALCYVC